MALEEAEMVRHIRKRINDDTPYPCPHPSLISIIIFRPLEAPLNVRPSPTVHHNVCRGISLWVRLCEDMYCSMRVEVYAETCELRMSTDEVDVN